MILRVGSKQRSCKGSIHSEQKDMCALSAARSHIDRASKYCSGCQYIFCSLIK